MATRKKKPDGITLDMPGTIGGAKIILPGIKIVKESHLTITYDANNYPVKLEWDDEALMRDVGVATASVEFNNLKPVKVTRQKKSKAAE